MHAPVVRKVTTGDDNNYSDFDSGIEFESIPMSAYLNHQDNISAGTTDMSPITGRIPSENQSPSAAPIPSEGEGNVDGPISSNNLMFNNVRGSQGQQHVSPMNRLYDKKGTPLEFAKRSESINAVDRPNFLNSRESSPMSPVDLDLASRGPGVGLVEIESPNDLDVRFDSGPVSADLNYGRPASESSASAAAVKPPEIMNNLNVNPHENNTVDNFKLLNNLERAFQESSQPNLTVDEINTLKSCDSWYPGMKEPIWDRRHGGTHVWAHIYEIDTVTEWLNDTVLANNRLGAYHVGIEIYGDEWSFLFYNDVLDLTTTGVNRVFPRTHPEFKFKTSVYMGRTEVSTVDVGELILAMMDAYPTVTYHITDRNCVDFAFDLCRRLNVPRRLPEWVCGGLGMARDTDSLAAGLVKGTVDTVWNAVKWWNRVSEEEAYVAPPRSRRLFVSKKPEVNLGHLPDVEEHLPSVENNNIESEEVVSHGKSGTFRFNTNSDSIHSQNQISVLDSSLAKHNSSDNCAIRDSDSATSKSSSKESLLAVKKSNRTSLVQDEISQAVSLNPDDFISDDPVLTEPGSKESLTEPGSKESNSNVAIQSGEIDFHRIAEAQRISESTAIKSGSATSSSSSTKSSSGQIQIGLRTV